MREELVHVGLLAAEAGHQREVHVHGEAGLSPSLYGETADEAEAPTLAPAELLDIQGRAEDRVHVRERRRWKRACCVTRPECMRRRGLAGLKVARERTASLAARAWDSVNPRRLLLRSSASAGPALVHCS